MTEKKHSYGKFRSGVEFTDEVIERMAAEADAGLDVSKLRRRPGGHGWVRRLRSRSPFASSLSCVKLSSIGQKKRA